jgi:hypothetical protein
VNGEPKPTGSLPGNGVLTLDVCWVRRDPEKAPPASRRQPEFNEQEWVWGRIEASLGGLDSGAEEHVRWFREELRVGDELTLRLLPPGESDQPNRRYSTAEGG